MGMPLFWSASTKAVQAALADRYPEAMMNVDEKRDYGVKTVVVIELALSLEEDAIIDRCIDVHARAQKVSSLPVSVMVKGYGGAACLTNAECEGIAESIQTKFGETAIIVFLFNPHKPESGGYRAITADPIQSALLTAMMNPSKKPRRE